MPRALLNLSMIESYSSLVRVVLALEGMSFSLERLKRREKKSRTALSMPTNWCRRSKPAYLTVYKLEALILAAKRLFTI